MKFSHLILVGAGLFALANLSKGAGTSLIPANDMVTAPTPPIMTETTEPTYTADEAKALFNRLHEKIINLRHEMNPYSISLSRLKTQNAYITKYPGATWEQAYVTNLYKMQPIQQTIDGYLEQISGLQSQKDELRRYF